MYIVQTSKNTLFLAASCRKLNLTGEGETHRCITQTKPLISGLCVDSMIVQYIRLSVLQDPLPIMQT